MTAKGGYLLQEPAAAGGIWTVFAPTVTLVGGEGNVVPVYTTNTGRYYVLGKSCIANILLSGDGGDEGAGTGVLNIAIPIAVGASVTTGSYTPGFGSFGINGGTMSAFGPIILTASAVTITLGLMDPAGFVPMTGAFQANTSRIIGAQFSYEID